MSIQQVQAKNILDLVAKAHFIDGQNPQFNTLQAYVSKFFSTQRISQPYKIPMDTFREGLLSDPELMNEFMALMIVNLDTLYETCFEHIDQILALNTVLRDHLDRLKMKRSLLSSKIDDYLLGIFNSDGYFYSFSDDFSTGYFTDFGYTSAFLDMTAGVITIPPIADKSRSVHTDSIATPSVTVTNANGDILNHTVKASFDNAVDGLNNTAWHFEVRTNDEGPITANVNFLLSSATSTRLVTKLDLTPFGVNPVQCGVNALHRSTANASYTIPFSKDVKTSSDKMVFMADNPAPDLAEIRLQLSKQTPDYYINDSTTRTGVYVFGFKEISATEQYYDPAATWVSLPISIPESLGDEAVIDAVSLVTTDNKPSGSDITYYVAADNTDATELSDFDWKQIRPITDTSGGNLVRFDGSVKRSRMIRMTPRNDNDVQMIQPNTTNPDLSKRNPTSAYFTDFDAYRITDFTEEFLAGTLSLAEGVNTTRILYVPLDEDAISDGFAFWKTVLDSHVYSSTYGEIDTGNEYLYGADIGTNGVSVYSETFLFAEEDMPVILKECHKADANSKTWDVKVFLNGREIASMPEGVHKLTVPWRFRAGKNHIVVMANIPEYSSDSNSPYLGSFSIMSDSDLWDYGVVKLDDWNYVDDYKIVKNHTNESKVFTIYNGEIVSRREPTTNFKLSWAQSTGAAPESIRLRADMSRSSTNSNTSPSIDMYRLRFAYS